MKKPSGRNSKSHVLISHAASRDGNQLVEPSVSKAPSRDGIWETMVVSLPGSWDAGLAIAASRCGAVGLLDLTYCADAQTAKRQIERLSAHGRGRLGLVLHGKLEAAELAALESIGSCDTVVLQPEFGADLAPALAHCRGFAARVGIVATSESDAVKGLEGGAEFLIAKGHEAGGRVSDETSLILLKRLLAVGDRPVFAWGGVGWNSAAACYAAGAAGAVLDWQLSLLRESPLDSVQRRQIQAFTGCETIVVAGPDGQSYRVLCNDAAAKLQAVAAELSLRGSNDQIGWHETLCHLMRHPDSAQRLTFVGQDAILAGSIARRGASVGRVLRTFDQHVHEQVSAAAVGAALAEGAPLSRSHGTALPIVQSPSAWECRSVEFCAAVAETGGLPVISLDGATVAETKSLLVAAKKSLGKRPWGVSLMRLPADSPALADIVSAGPTCCFVPADATDFLEQLRQRNLAAYSLVGHPAELSALLARGQRRFALLSHEGGGRIGPLSSLTLWDAVVSALVDAQLSTADAESVHVLFGAGVHDGLTAAMAAAAAQPLVQRSMKVGMLLGTAYVFTEEALAADAITAEYQQAALETEHTTVHNLEDGQAIRCGDESRVPLGPAPAQSAAGYRLGQAAALCSEVTTVRSLHDDVCGGGLARLGGLAHQAVVEVAAQEPTPPPMDIAIVGMSVLLPGAHDLQTYWENIVQKRDVVREIPADRFDVSRWYDAGRGVRDKVNSKWGGFLDDVAFDPMKYGIPPATLKSIEPAQLLALELVDRALTDAGYREENPLKARTSLIFGAGGGIAELGAKYALRAMLPAFVDNLDESVWHQLPEWTEDSFAGILLNVITGRVSNRFDFGGTNFTVDAACASSLGAIYLACRELVDGTSDMVVTGGCDTVQNPFSYLCFATAGALSPTGRSKTFDAKADGIAISEGCAAIVLKRLTDAERDGDRVYAVIRAAAGASDGRSKGLTAPRVEGQMRTLERAYAQAGFSPASVGLIEAHGTGTAVGDQTECTGVTNVLKAHGATPQSCAIGSVKSMMGHTKCTAGVAGLIKAALALHYRVLPPTMHVESPSGKGGLLDGPLYVNSELRPWIRGTHPRRAGVSSFGFGGTNFHAVLEEYEGEAAARVTPSPRQVRSAELFAFSGANQGEVAAQAQSLLEQLTAAIHANAEFSLGDLAYSVHRRSSASPGPCRAAVVVRNVGQLANHLHALIEHLTNKSEKKLPPGVFVAAAPLGGKVAWLFPGQGSQYPNMLREAALEFAEAAACFERADAVLVDRFTKPLSAMVFPPPAFNDADRAAARKELKMTDAAQPALGASDLAAARILSAFGAAADMVAGHSYGELVALCVAGAMEEDELYRLSAARGRAIVDMCQGGGSRELGQMLAARACEADTLTALGDCPDVWLANLNSQRQTVISGTQAGLALAQERLEAAKIPCTPVPVSCGFHSPLMGPARDRFAEVLAQASLVAPQLPVYSNTTGKMYGVEPAAIRSTLAEHLVRQVRFADEIEAMLAAGAKLFVEVGPGRVLSRLVDDIAGSRQHVSIPLQDAHEDGLVSLLDGLAQLYVYGALSNLSRLYEHRTVNPIDLTALAIAKPPALPRHAWLVNGSYARPASEPRRVPKPLARLSSANDNLPNTLVKTQTSPMSASSFDRHDTSAPATAVPATPPPTAIPAPAVIGLSPAAAVSAPLTATMVSVGDDPFAQFQHTMRQFLATQETIMLAYLGAAPAPPAPSTVSPLAIYEAPAAITAPPPAPMIVAPVVAVPASAVPAQQAPVAARQRSLHEMLLDIVSERTGYPSEMLSLDAALEGDLGIDSIKRVEIIGVFRRAAVPGLVDPPASFMEQMSAASTLRQVLEGVQALCPTTSETAAAAPAAEVAVTAAAAAALDLEAALLGAVSERTGYPAEMLSLDANLEGDLGIDSIKRVEIIGAIRRLAVPGLDEPPASFMEQMSAATTLRQILEGVRKLTGVNGKPAAPPAAADVPAASSQTFAPASIDLEASLLGVVSERTGYPSDMLSLDANLEGDLGIDSIKRVEIIGAFRRAAAPHIAEPPVWFMERMSAAGNLRTILQGVRELVGDSQPAALATADDESPTLSLAQVENAAPVASTLADQCPRCVAAVVEAPLDAESSFPLPEGVVLVTDDGGRIAPAVAAAIEERGGAAIVLSANDLRSREAAAGAVDAIRRRQPIAGVIHVAPLSEAPAFPEIDRDSWDARIDEELRGMLFLVQAVAPELTAAAHERFAVVSASLGGADFDSELSVEARHPWRGGLTGLLRCAAKEWTGARFRAVDLDALPEPDSTTGLLTVCGLLIEEFTASGPIKVGYRQGRRLTVVPQRQELPGGAHAAPAIRREDVVLVTGGARGITAVVAEELARRSQPTLVLLGRSAAPSATEDPRTASIEGRQALVQKVVELARQSGEALKPKDVELRVSRVFAEREVRRTLSEIRAAGARVEYVSCDVRDASRLTQVVRDVQNRFGEITAVIHGAGAIEDKYIVDKSAESFARVLGTKLDPLMTLVRLIDPRQLKVLMLFSSVSGFFGNPGQADYAAANEILNLVGANLNRLWPTRVVSINWGPWSGAGMVTDAVAAQFESRGVGMVTVPAGREVAVRELLEPHPGQTCVLYGPGPWVDEADSQASAATRHSVTTPLLAGQDVQRESGDVVTARVVLDRRRHAYLRDHEIDNKPVLPLAVAMEMMAELANFAAPHWHVTQLSGLRLFSGVMIEGDERTVQLRAEPIERGADQGAWRVRVTDENRPLPPLYECVVRLTAEAPIAPPAPDLTPAAQPFPLDVEQAYDQWLFHGATLQVITELTGLDAQGVDAVVRPGCWRTSVGQHVQQGWLIDPLVLDAAPQLAILWSRATHDATPLPNRVGRYHRFGPMGGDPIQVHYRVENGTDGNNYKASVWFIRDGRVLGMMEGLEGAGSQELNRITQPTSRR